MYQKIINFVKYHNAFTIGLVLVFVFSGAIFASEDIRDAVIGEEIVTEQGIDNSQFLVTDLENFDLQMQIIGVTEDENKYYVVYQYRTLAVKDNVWQIAIEQPTLTVYKDALGNSDLGLYVTKKLSEVADYALNFLKEVQTAEKEKGLTKLVASVEYTGLIGLVLDVKEKVLPGYEPVVQAPEPEPEPQTTGESRSSQPSEPAQPLTLQVITEEQLSQKSVDPEFIRQLVQEILAQQSSTPTLPTEEPPAPAPAPEPEPPIEQPVAEEPPAEEPPTGELPAEDVGEVGLHQQVCDNEHLELCNTQELCEGISLYWYNEQCNLEAQVVEESEIYRGSPPVNCASNWSCSDWQPLPETQACGQTFTQTRTCTDLNNCGIDEGKPAENQEVVGADAISCGTTSCDAILNLTGECQNTCAEGACQACAPTCACAEGSSDCDGNGTGSDANGCEFASSTCPSI